MGKYLKIANKGEIDTRAFELMGACTKRNESEKIGFFGSGLKYSLAFMLRNSIEFECYSGKKRVKFSTKKENFRGTDFDVIYINKQRTSLTVQMGIDWKLWFIIRELYCNAIDESGQKIEVVDQINPCMDCTAFYIKVDESIQHILDDWNDYFSEKRDDLFYYDNDLNKLYEGSDKLIIYRKGIQCHHSNHDSLFHYDMQWVEINESRVVKSKWDFDIGLVKFFQKIKDKKVIYKILRDTVNCWEKGLAWDCFTHYYSEAWLSAIDGRWLVPYENSGMYTEEIKVLPCVIIPSDMVKGLKDKFGDQVKVMGEGETNKEFKVLEVDQRQEFLLNECHKFFGEAGYKITYPIKVCRFQQPEVLGRAFEDTILVSEKAFNSGRKEIAKIIVEENEHLKSGYGDETRAFQTHLLEMYLSEVEKRCAYFL